MKQKNNTLAQRIRFLSEKMKQLTANAVNVVTNRQVRTK